ncbi:exosortase A [Paucibacter sp. R3-3]|uniref:Exosortase A n=1 Tax=Roseateles agri TaxID=3098619 RepID=A0ABU5DLR6_9BURK|nr:exosortase A [Paucibacter sp. R3-3]MDY0747238.1 exosortase A [Paucibacter sp. R3-3]
MTPIPVPWRLPLLALTLAWALLATLYFDTGAAMVHIWDRSETFAHAWVVPPLAIWLVWRRRAELAALTPRPALRWLWLLPLLGLLWLAGDLAAAHAATQFALVGMLVAVVPALLGTDAARRIAFPLGFLFFAVPFGDFLTPWLVDRTADFTVLALRATGIPVFREATQFVIPTGSWSVVQACSGIRYLMASIMVGTLFAYLNYRSNGKRWAFVGVAIITPLVANWLRAYMIVMLGHLSGNRIATGVDHIIYGWVFFGIVMLVMFIIGARWSDPDGEPAPAALREVASDAAPRRAATVLSAALLLIALPIALRAQVEHAAPKSTPSLAAPTLPGWTWNVQPLSDWTPHFDGMAATLRGRYEPTAGGPAVGVFIGYYRNQSYGRQLITSTNDLVEGDDERKDPWARTASGLAGLDNAQPWLTAELRGQALSQVTGSGELAPRLRVWQRYWINGRSFTSDWQAKLYGAWCKLLGQGDDAAVVIVYADKVTGGGDDDVLLRGFLHQHAAALNTALQDVRDHDAAHRP